MFSKGYRTQNKGQSFKNFLQLHEQKVKKI